MNRIANFDNTIFGVNSRKDMFMPNKTKVICRPCKEENNWEIVAPNGRVLEKHYDSKSACVNAARTYAQEHGSELFVMDSEQNRSKRSSRRG